MKCKKYEEYRVLYACDELKGKEKKVFEEHLNTCPHCQKYIEEFKKVLYLYEELPKREPSSRIVNRILKRVGSVKKPVTARERIFITRPVKWGIPVFAGAVVVLLLLLLPRMGTEGTATIEDRIWTMNNELVLMTETADFNGEIDTRIEELESELTMLESEW